MKGLNCNHAGFRKGWGIVCVTITLWAIQGAARATDVRIKDIATVDGVRTNELLGVGLVTGLNGTGSKAPITREFAVNMIQRFGLRADPVLRRLLREDTRQKTDNLSVVTVSAKLPIFKQPGQTLDVTVATFDDAKSLQGGVLIMTPLLGVDSEVYAVASGPLKVGGFSFSGQGASVQKNHTTTAVIPGGAVIEKQVPYPFGLCPQLRILLDHADFTTAGHIAEAINRYSPGAAFAQDAGVIRLVVPDLFRGRVGDFLSHIESLPVAPDVVARVVINERTGTVVIGEHVRLSKAAITHANLAVVTAETPEVSQPAPFSNGETTVVPRTEIDVTEESNPVRLLEDSVTVGDLADALNALGASPRDLASIFQLLKSAGALHAQLEFQ